MDKNHADRADLKRALHHLARIGRRLADRPVPDEIVGDQLVLRGQEERPEPLDCEVRHVGAQIIEQLARGRDDRPPRQRQAKAVEEAVLDMAKEACGLRADDPRLLAGLGGESRRKRAEALDQSVGPAGGVGGPGWAEERVQEGSAPLCLILS